MFVYSQLQPHLIFLIIMLVLCWSLATWLTWQNKKQYCELIPQFSWISRYGLLTGTILMIFSLWFLSLFYSELRLGMTIIFASIIFFIPAIRINYYLKFFKKFYFDRKIFIAREMTKKHETHYRDYVDKIKPFKNSLKGELTVVISQKFNKSKTLQDYSNIEKQIKYYLKTYKVKDIVELMSVKEKISKKIVYQLCLKNKK